MRLLDYRINNVLEYYGPLTLSLAMTLALLFSCAKNPTGSNNTPPPPPTEYGALEVAVVGLPPFIAANITVTGPNSYSKRFTQGFTIDSLPVGVYTIDAAPVVDSNGITIAVNPKSQKVTIANQKTTKTQVFYQGVDLGSLRINCSGLPANSAYDIVVVSNIDTTTRFIVTQTTQLDSLKIGSYTVTAKKVTGSDGKPYKPKVITVQAIIIKAKLSEVGVEYEPTFGNLDILVNGLPADVMNSIHIIGPEYDETHGNLHRVLDSLLEGDYLVIGNEVMGPDLTEYAARPDTQSVKVIAGETAYLTVNYERKYGALDITVTGLPIGALSIVDVRNSAGKSERYGNLSHLTLDTLPAGFYWVIGNEVIASDGTPWVAKPDTQKVYITPGDTTYVTVTYSEKLGHLALAVTGLPDGVSGYITLKNSDETTQWIRGGSDIIDSIDPGMYSLIAEKVVDNSGDTLYPKPDSQNVTITAGDTAKASVEYTPGFDVFVYYGPSNGSSYYEYGSGTGLVLATDTIPDTTLDNAWVFDTTSFEPLPSCEIQNLDFTDSLITNNSASTGIGAASANSNALLVSSRADHTVTITMKGSAIALPITAIEGTATAWSFVGKGGSWPIFALAINNPFGDTLAVTVKWNVDGVAQFNTDTIPSSNWNAMTYIFKDFNACATSASPEVVFNARYDFRGGVMGEVSGTYTYLVTKDFENVGFSFYALVGAYAYKGTDPRPGHYGQIDVNSESSLAATVTIDVKRKR